MYDVDHHRQISLRNKGYVQCAQASLRIKQSHFEKLKYQTFMIVSWELEQMKKIFLLFSV